MRFESSRVVLHACLALALPLGACTSFSAVRSAEVRPGFGIEAVASLSGKVGDEVGWFYSLDCAENCDRHVPALDAAVSYGWPRVIGDRPIAVALGSNGLYPYADAYVQVGKGSLPFGVGGRAGLPVTGWAEHQLYGRLDIPLGSSTRLLFNPALFVLTGQSPNHQDKGSIVAFVQGVGLEIDAGYVAFTPAFSLVAGRVERSRYDQRDGPSSVLFPTVSLGISLHQAPRRP